MGSVEAESGSSYVKHTVIYFPRFLKIIKTNVKIDI